MQNCNHRVVFLENSDDENVNLILIYARSLVGRCPVCKDELDKEEIRDALLEMYSPEVAELIFVAFENKRSYLAAVSKLSANGITTALSPRVDND